MANTAVVILNYNGADYLKQFLPSVLAHSINADIIVADNASTDASVDFLKAEYPQIRLILLDKNLGYAGGYNEALKEIDHEFSILLNSDIEVTDGWIEPVIQFMVSHPEVAACQPKILDFNAKDKFEYAGAAGGFIDYMGYPYCRGRIFDDLETDQGQYNTATEIHWTTGACLFVRTSLFKEAGGFDADFFAHMEEIDLCWRLRLMGHSLFCIPESKIYHVGGGTLNKLNPRKTYLNFRNNLSLLVKNLPLLQLFWKLPFKFFLDWTATLKFILDGSAAHGLAVIRSQFDFLLFTPKNLKKRRQIAKLKKKNVQNSRLLLPFQYFIKRKTTYSQLHANQ